LQRQVSGEPFARGCRSELRSERVVASMVEALECRESEQRVELTRDRGAGEIEVEPTRVSQHVDGGIDAERPPAPEGPSSPAFHGMLAVTQWLISCS
jgi:hypothetical protein